MYDFQNCRKEKYFENTISSYNYICSNGADGVEIDVQLSGDRVNPIPIVFHDFSFKIKSGDHNENLSIKNIRYQNLQKVLLFVTQVCILKFCNICRSYGAISLLDKKILLL